MSVDCAHLEFAATCDVHRLEDVGEFRLDVRVNCVRCGELFRFKGTPPGINQRHPTVSADGTELSVEIEPEGQKRFFTRIPVRWQRPPEKA